MIRRLFLSVFVFSLLTTQMSFASLLKPLGIRGVKRALMRGAKGFSSEAKREAWNEAFVRSLAYTRLGLSCDQAERVHVYSTSGEEQGIWISHDAENGADPTILYSGLLAFHNGLSETQGILAWQALHALAHIAGGSLPTLREFKKDNFPGIVTPNFRDRRWQLARSLEEHAVAVANAASSASEKKQMLKELGAIIELWEKETPEEEKAKRDERKAYEAFDPSEALFLLPSGHIKHSLTYASIVSRIAPFSPNPPMRS